MQTEKYLSLDCVRLANDAVELLITQSVGPRVIYLGLPGGENLLAELPDMSIEGPGLPPFHLRGGHRLWHAPEVKRRTYIPDDAPVIISEIEQGVEVVQPTEAETGIQKSMKITLIDDTPQVVIEHTLINEGLWPIELAPWAITMLKPGGVAILPQRTSLADMDGVLPNRSLVLWPYTDLNSPHLHLGNECVLIQATMPPESEALKVGFPNPRGWIAYHVDETLFLKEAAYYPDATYPDDGCSSECYCHPRFIEMETLGPMIRLAPGEAISHRELWRLYENASLDATEDSARQLVAALDL